MLDRDPRDIGRFDRSTFLSAPVSASETSTIGKPMKSATECIETVGEGLVRTEKRALVCRLKIVYNTACVYVCSAVGAGQRRGSNCWKSIFVLESSVYLQSRPITSSGFLVMPMTYAHILCVRVHEGRRRGSRVYPLA